MVQASSIFWLLWLAILPQMWGQPHRPQQTIQEYWDAPSQTWVAEQRSSFRYNEQGDLVATQRELWDPSQQQWLPSQVSRQVYDESGLLLQQQVHTANLPAWVDWPSSPCYRDYERDPLGRILFLRKRVPAGQHGQLITIDSQAYHYQPDMGDEPQMIQSFIRQDSAGLTWSATTRYVYIYDQQGRLVYEREERRSAVQPAWTREVESYVSYDERIGLTRRMVIQRHGPYLATRQLITHDDFGQIIQKRQAVRHAPEADWLPLFEVSYRYDQQGQIAEKIIHSQWLRAAQGWQRRFVQQFERRTDGQPAAVIASQYQIDPSGSQSSPQLLSQIEEAYQYDAWDRIATYTQQQRAGGKVRPNLRIRHLYPAAQPTAQRLRLYPNPAEHQIHVSGPGEEQLEGQLLLRDLAGRKLWTGTASLSAAYPYTLPIQSWQPGQYLLEFRQGSQHFYATFIKR